MNKKKNLIMITIDSLRADHLGCYGYSKSISPNIDKFAENSLLFKDAIANGSSTRVSVASTLTSNYPFGLNSSSPTLAEVLKEEGYQTAAFNPNARLVSGPCEDLKLTRGFDKYDLILSDNEVEVATYLHDKYVGLVNKLRKSDRMSSSFLYHAIARLMCLAPFPLTISDPAAELVNRKAIEWLSATARRPFFLWLFYLDVHEPYLPERNRSIFKRFSQISLNRKLRYFRQLLSEPEIKKLHALYKEKICDLDAALGSLMHRLKDLDLYDESVIILTADHGEQFNEHGHLGHPGDLYEEQLHVPLIINNLGQTKGIVKQQVSLLDVAPTLVEIAGGKCSDFIGQSLLSTKYQEQPVVSSANFEASSFSYRKSGWKLIVKEKSTFELFNLEEDPDEKSNLYPERKALAEKLLAEALDILKRRMSEIDKTGSSEEFSSKEEKQIKERLRDLGYLD